MYILPEYLESSSVIEILKIYNPTNATNEIDIKLWWRNWLFVSSGQNFDYSPQENP